MIWISDEDIEDYEQEIKIREWLQAQGKKDACFEFKSINRKGNARNTGVRASISLDQEIKSDSKGTFADIIAGSDGRDLYCGEHPCASEVINVYLTCLGFDEEIIEWITKTLKSSMKTKSWHLEKLAIDSEW